MGGVQRGLSYSAGDSKGKVLSKKILGEIDMQNHTNYCLASQKWNLFWWIFQFCSLVETSLYTSVSVLKIPKDLQRKPIVC